MPAEIDAPSYTVDLLTPCLYSSVFVSAPNEITARLSIAEDIARGFRLGHECKPIVYRCTKNERGTIVFI